MDTSESLGPVLAELHSVTRRVFASADTNEVLRRIVDGVCSFAGFEIAAISRLGDDDMLTLVALSGSEEAREAMLGRRTPLERIQDEFDAADQWGLLRFIPEGRLDDAARTGWVPELVPEEGDDAWLPEDTLFAPLYSPANEMIGLMSVDVPTSGRRPDEFSRLMLELYAVQAGVALDAARQRERLRAELRLAQATRDIAALAAAEDLTALFEGAVDPVLSALDADYVWIATTAAVGQDDGAPLQVHEGRPGVPEVQPLPQAELIARGETLWRERRAAFVDAAGERSDALLADDPSFGTEALAARGLGRMLVLALGGPEDYLGVLVVARVDQASAWSDSAIESAGDLGRELTLAMRQCTFARRDRELMRRLQELDVYKRRMFATLTHELKNPLTSIVGHAEVLGDVEGAEQSAGAVGRNARRLLDLAQNLLTLARLDDADAPMERTEVDLAAVIEDARETLAVQAERRGIVVHVVTPREPVVVLGEAGELGRVVLNLISNAVKFSRDDARVEVRLGTESDDELAVLSVADSGIGIPEADQAAIFREFQRSSDPAARAVPGSGLGLAITRRVVDRHGGTISVVSAPGEGSTFEVRLPAARAATGDTELAVVPDDEPPPRMRLV